MKRLPALALLASILLTAGAKKPPQLTISFNPQASSAEGGEFSRPVPLVQTKKEVNMKVLPLITQRDIKSYLPFQNADGSWGASFRLDAHGSNLLSQHTLSMRGTHLLVWVNGRHVIDLFIDRPVQDGVLSIPGGLTANEVEMMKYQIPLMGHEKDKLPKPEKKPRKPPTEKADATTGGKPY
jgi:hypothetical protein